MSGGKKAVTINSYLFSDHQMISLKLNDQKKDAGNPELMVQDKLVQLRKIAKAAQIGNRGLVKYISCLVV